MSFKHDDFYARAWECEYEHLIFDAKKNSETPPKSTETPVQSDLSTEEMRNTSGTTHECSPELFPQSEELCDVTDTYPDMERDVEINSEQPNSSRTNPRSSKYNLCHNTEPNRNYDYGY